jgi:translation initiation factor 4A
MSISNTITENNDLLNPAITDTTINEFPIISKWDDLNLPDKILQGIYGYGLENPSPIQSKAILPVMSGRDVIAQAQSGTGKTATFVISVLTKIKLDVKEEQIIIIAPTRELVFQIENVVNNISTYMDGLCVRSLVGGTSINKDIQQYNSKVPQIIVGCPGRILDFIERRVIKLDNLECLVLDEADELLSEGFRGQIQNIIGKIRNTTQVAIFSATMTENTKELTKLFMNNPIEILVKQEQLTLEGIRQYYVALNRDNDKYEVLTDLYSTICVSQCIIYCNSISRVINLYERLQADGFTVSYICGNMSTTDREKSMKDFRTGVSRILISSNVTSRGIDIQQVSVVINYDIPNDVSNYLHRIGRSGRWGRKGVAINFITRQDSKQMEYIERYYETQISELPEKFM